MIAIFTNKDADNFWIIKIINFEHNHVENALNAHSVFRQRIMTSKTKDKMICQLIIQIASFKILSVVWIDDLPIVNVIFIFRNVYNFQTLICRDEFGFLIFIQILIREFDETDWIYAFQKNEKNQIIFFSLNVAQKNSENKSRNFDYEYHLQKKLFQNAFVNHQQIVCIGH